MRLDPLGLAAAMAGASALFMIVWAIFTWSAPGAMHGLFDPTAHQAMGGWRFRPDFGDSLMAGLAWLAIAAIFGWLIAVLYNAASGHNG